MKIRAVLEWDNVAKAYSATCPELSFVSSCGESREKAIENLKDAIALMLEPTPAHSLGMEPLIPVGTLKAIEKQADFKFL